MTNEVRTTSASGGQKGVKDERFDLLPIEAMTKIARHYGIGARKYDDNQWRKGYEWSKSYAALQRHLTAFWGGEDTDEETGSPHLAAAGWHILTLLTFMDDFPEYDDRYKKPTLIRDALPEDDFKWKVGDKVWVYPTVKIEGPEGPQSFTLIQNAYFEERY